MRGRRWDVPDLKDQLEGMLGRERFEREIKRIKKEWLILNEKGAIILLAKEYKLI
ncbi:hypothetical protein ACO3UB_08380 (plasmid) [Methanocaldococcus sp. 16A]